MVTTKTGIERTVLTVPELAGMLNINTKTAYSYLEQGTIPAFKAGKKHWVISKVRIEQWLEKGR